MEEILGKIEKLNQHFRKTEQSESSRLLQRIVKLNEEVGELCEAALTETDPDQRKKDRIIDFDAELSDVMICTLMLSTGRKKNIIDSVNATLDKHLKRLNLD